jgi:hypothetical protein
MAKKSLKNVNWREVKAPTSWRPKKREELVGYYMGRTKKNGKFGQYEVLTVLVPYKGVVMISGTMIIQLADAAMFTPGDAIRIVYEGQKELEGDRSMKMFKLYVGDGVALPIGEIPERLRS